MRTIYFKSAKKSYKSLKDLLKHYHELHNPATYWADDDTEQCDSNRHRSVEDLLLLANNYFQETSIKDMMKAYLEYNNELLFDNKELIFAVCSTIGRVRLCNHKYDTGSYNLKNMLYVDGMSETAKNGDYQMTDLEKIMGDL